jgi:hypothetical protein
MRNWGDMKITYGLVLAIRIGPARCQQPKEMRLTRAIRSQHRNTVTEPDLSVEWPHQASQFEIVDHDRTLAGTPSTQAHRHSLLKRHRLRRSGFLELGEPSLGT